MSLSLLRVCVDLDARRAIDDVSLAVQPGEIVALLGPNGAGKTTLMRAALGFAPLAAGEARVGGDDPRRLTSRARALRAAYLPQRPHTVWPVTVEALVALGRFAHGAAPDRLAHRDRTAVDSALAMCALTPLRARRMDQISGGEKARAHLARALAQQAPVLVLDEPGAGLDPAQALTMGEILRARRSEGAAILLSTHDVGLAASIADRVALLREGRMIAEGAPNVALTPEALRTAYGKPGELVRVGDGYAAAFRA